MSGNINLITILMTAALGLLTHASLKAQPQPCGSPAAMTSTCAQACVVCDINGFTGRNNSSVQGQAPPGFCTSVVHHMQWIAFIAGSTNLTLRVDVFNCQLNRGLEIGIYQTNNCSTFSLVSNCNTDVPPNNSGIFTNTVPLVVGQHYYFVMDGNGNDICNYTITVISGSTLVSPLTNTDTFSGPDIVCPGDSATFSVPTQSGAAFYQWTLNGITVGNNQTLNHAFPNTPGQYQLCVTAANACSAASPACRTITVPNTPVTNLNTTICPGDCITIADTILCQPGTYSRLFLSSSGCDSLVNITVTQRPAINTSLLINICDGDTLLVGGAPYTTTGQYLIPLQAANGCDSIVSLSLNSIICEIEATITALPVSCRGDTDGQLRFSVQNGTPPFSYTWQQLGQPGSGGQGTLTQLGQRDTLRNLPPGQYLITIEDLFGNDVVLIGHIDSPESLTAILNTSNYQGFGVSCHQSTDGTISVSPQGGTPPYLFSWSHGQQSPTATQLGAGNYQLTLTDNRGCTATAQATLTQPDALRMQVIFTNPGCEGPTTGSIRVESSSGGVPPYQYAINLSPFSGNANFPNLPQGNYLVQLLDANACSTNTSGTLSAAAIPVVSLGPDLTVRLGDVVRLQASSNIPLAGSFWTPANPCIDCLFFDTLPRNTDVFTFTGISADGCQHTDSLTVTVIKNRDIYAPNAFSPDNNGINDAFVLYGGPAVARIARLRVFSRWGELLYERHDFPEGDPAYGWDGRFLGQAMPGGTYTWMADVLFIDGVVVLFEGDTTMVR
jgi:gliding motility-associated-like protein